MMMQWAKKTNSGFKCDPHVKYHEGTSSKLYGEWELGFI